MQEDLWQAIISCDPRYDGHYYYGVKTTHIFCRPSCKSKTPQRKNVRIFTAVDEAIASGFRPCKRCRPELATWHGSGQITAEQVMQVITTRFHEPLTLTSIANTLYMSPYYIHHLFKQAFGITPAEALQQQRIAAARHLLTQPGISVTEIALTVGFRTSAHFATVFQKLTGFTPTAFRTRCFCNSTTAIVTGG